MPIIEGVGDEVVYVAVFAASVVLIFRPSLWHCSVSLGKLGVNLTRKCFQRIWNGVRALSSSNNMDSSRATSTEQEGFLMRMDSPPENDCCSVCHDNFDLPCQANCAHWFCGDCILRVWHHSSALQPCKCPICRRPINLLIPCDSASQRRNEPEVDSVLQNIEKYNRIFGGGSVGFFQRLWDTPLLLRRLLRELMDPQRALPLVFRARIVCFCIQNNKMGQEWTLCIQVKCYPNPGHSIIEYVLRNNVLNEVIHRKKRNTWNNNGQRGLLHWPYIRVKNCQNVQIQWHICLHQF